MKKIIINIAAFLVLVSSFGQEIASFSSAANAGCSGPVYTNPNITTIGICRGSGIIEANGGTYNSKGWTIAAILDANDYLEWSLTPNAGYELDLSSMDIRYDRGGNGPKMAEIQVSTGLGFTTIFSDVEVDAAGENNLGIDLSALTDLTSTVTFRLYAFDAMSPAGTFDIEERSGVNKGIILYGTTRLACTSTTTWTAGAWNNDPPDLTYTVVINDNYNTTANGNFSACKLTVNTGFTLAIDDGDYVEVQNDIIVNTGGTFIVRPQGAVVQIDDTGTVTADGTITVEKETAPLRAWYEYTYWSSPVESETIGSALSDSDVNRRFWFDASMFEDSFYENANDNTLVAGAGVDDIDDDNNDWQYANAATTMTPGVGYAATHSEAAYFVPPGPNPPVPQFKYSFDGPFNTGVINVPVVRNDGSALDNNWNFIGNPYPSAIDITSFFTQNIYNAGNAAGTLEGAIYFWSQNTAPEPDANGNQNLNFAASDYATHNGIGGIMGGDGVMPNGFIPSGQGFFVSFSQARPTNTGNVVFNNAMRVRGATDNSQFFRTSGKQSKKKNNPNKLWVNLTSDNGVLNQTLIGYVSSATNNNDGMYYDAPRNLSTGAAAILYTNIENSNKKFAIQGKAENSINEDEVISLGFKTTIDVATIYTLSLAQLQGDFLSNNAIYVKDNLLNKLHDLKTNDYNFTSEVGEFNERFEIVFNSEALSTDENLIKNQALSIIELQNGDVQFKLSGNIAMASIQIIDLQGRVLYSLSARGNSNTYNLSNLSQAPYIAKVVLTDGHVITKKALKRY